jgi:hypothetical protein
MKHRMQGTNDRRAGMVMACLVVAGLGVLTTRVPPGWAGAEEVSLRYTLDPGGPPVSTPGQDMVASDAPLQRLKLPPLHTKKPLYLTARLGDGADPTYTFVLDESEPGAGYDLLYADSHHLRDLTAEKPYHLTRWGFYKGFKPVRLLLDIGGSPTLYHAAIVAEDRGSSTEYRLQSWAYYSGEARFGDKSCPVALVDANGNGRFNDLSQGLDPERGGDLLLMDLNGDGKFDETSFAGPELQRLGRRLAVDGRYYDLEVSPDGAGFRAAPSTARLATLRSTSDQFALLLVSSDGMLTVHGEHGQASIPLGDYTIAGWQVQQRDQDGSVWVVEGTQHKIGSPAPRLAVKGDTQLPRLGSPLQAELQVQPSGGREFDVQLSFTAGSGEVIEEVSHAGQPMPAPHLRIVDARGKEIANLPFHYG